MEFYKYDEVLELIAKNQGIPMSSNLIADLLGKSQNKVSGIINYLLKKKDFIMRIPFGVMRKSPSYYIKHAYNLYKLTPKGIKRVKQYSNADFHDGILTVSDEKEIDVRKVKVEYFLQKDDLADLRKSLGLTQKEFAERLGYSGIYIKTIESGKRKVTKEMKERVLLTFTKKSKPESLL